MIRRLADRVSVNSWSCCGLTAKRRLSLVKDNEFLITGTLKSSGPVIGAYAEVCHAFPQESVNQFARICGDNNPLHISPEFAKTTIFGEPIVHGILVGSLFSTLFGRSINGAIYVSQNLNFKAPVYVNKKIFARMEIVEIKQVKHGQLLTCSTTCTVDNKLCIEGNAKVLLPTPK